MAFAALLWQTTFKTDTMHIRGLFLAATLFLAACGNAQNSGVGDGDASLRRDIGEMLLVGFRGTDIDSNSHIVRDIRDYGIGGVILFEYDAPSRTRNRNVGSRSQLRRLCSALQSAGEERLLIGIDQEGGAVNRLKEKYGFPAFGSAKATAAAGMDSVRACARLTASVLHELGVNLDFAPCVDVDVNPQCPVIGKLERSFSGNADRVAQCGAVWVEELQRQGVTACLKHFPGHGSSLTDTHLGVADVSDTWRDDELEPYRKLLGGSDIRMVMTTHVFNAKIDSLWPATLSRATLTGLLRDSLHFDGVIITDDLAMGAMAKHYGYDEMLRMTINAGADMLCLSNNGSEYDADIVPKTIELIYNMVERGEIPARRIRESAARIRRMKGM